MTEFAPVRTGPIRIGDAERDKAVSMLSDHFVAGRLTQDEFEERSDQATRARYADDLSPLFADLPDFVVQPSSPGFQPRPFIWLAPVLFVGLFVAAIVLTAPWILFVLLGIALFRGPSRHRNWHRHHPRMTCAPR